jgi:hypothetical protein
MVCKICSIEELFDWGIECGYGWDSALIAILAHAHAKINTVWSKIKLPKLVRASRILSISCWTYSNWSILILKNFSGWMLVPHRCLRGMRYDVTKVNNSERVWNHLAEVCSISRISKPWLAKIDHADIVACSFEVKCWQIREGCSHAMAGCLDKLSAINFAQFSNFQ